MIRSLYICLSLLLFLASCKDKETDAAQNPVPYTLPWPKGFPALEIPADNQLTHEGVNLGRFLFYEKSLSRNLSQSCASCHNQQKAFTDNGFALSTGVKGLPGKRNSMPVFNLILHRHGFFWDGRAKTLREQALHPIQDTLEMDETLERVVARLQQTAPYPDLFKKAFGTSDITPERIALALEQFMFTLISGNSKYDQYLEGKATLSASEIRGLKLFFTESVDSSSERGADCFHCHAGPDFTDHFFRNNGLDAIGADPGRYGVTGKNQDYGRFKTPSLRNIEQSAPYMHDGRFATLEEVIEHYNSGVEHAPNLDDNMHRIKEGLHLSAQEKTDLINFLKTLTDENYLNNPDYASPF